MQACDSLKLFLFFCFNARCNCTADNCAAALRIAALPAPILPALGIELLAKGLHPAQLASFPVRPYCLPSAYRGVPSHATAEIFLGIAAAKNADPEKNRGGNGGLSGGSSAEGRSCFTATDAFELLGTRCAQNLTNASLPGSLSACRECAVCICDFNGGELVRFLPCAHRFHVSCIDHWLADRTTCPVCRVDFKATASDVTVNDGVTMKGERIDAVS
ncbi:unnamed protein product [Closterium sp. NIES-54]